jgi:hypothetical protein
MTFAQIARRTGVPYYTILRWRDEKSTAAFREMTVVDKRKVATVTGGSVRQLLNVHAICLKTWSTAGDPFAVAIEDTDERCENEIQELKNKGSHCFISNPY